jgi:hypothetical protein
MASSAGPARAESSLGRKDRPSNPLALVFERDKHARTIRLHPAVLDCHVVLTTSATFGLLLCASVLGKELELEIGVSPHF